MFNWIQTNPIIGIILGAIALIVVWIVLWRWGKKRQK